MQSKRSLTKPVASPVKLPQGQLDSFALLLHRMTNRIRQSLELPEILAVTVAEVRAFLGTDRVKIYRFHEDGSGEVIAEAIREHRLPSLLHHNFPAEDIPAQARELFLKARQRSIVDVATQQIGVSSLKQGAAGDIRFRPVDPCHAEYLTAMGVKSSLVVPILDRDCLWGLLVSHHSTARRISERELQVVQLIADQVSMAIAQSTLLTQTRLRAQQEATINHIASLLHSTPEMQLQAALEQTVAALEGVGGRLYLSPQQAHQAPQLLTCGNQPQMPASWQHESRSGRSEGQRQRFQSSDRLLLPSEPANGQTGKQLDPHAHPEQPDPTGVLPAETVHSPDLELIPAQMHRQSGSLRLAALSATHPHDDASYPLHSLILEHHPHWQTWLEMEEPVQVSPSIWAITDLYRAVMPSDLALAFLAAQVRGILIIRLQYHQKTLGYLSVFRQEIDVERIWAGRIDRNDPRQQRPRLSFETWRELKQGQSHSWTAADIELAQALSSHFAMTLHQNMLYRQVCALNIDLEQDIQRRKQAELKISALNAELEQRVLQRTAELQQMNAELSQQIAERERVLAERQQVEASLARLSHQLELILNSAGEGIYGLDAQGKITFANLAAARMLGYDVDALVGQWMHTFLHHSKPDGTPYLLAESPIYLTLRNGTVHHHSEDLFWRRDGSSFPVEYISTPICEQGEIVGAVVLFKDITARQHVEQMKDEFVSIVSHELRTPLTSIRSTLGLLASGWLNSHPEKSQRMLEIAFSNTNRLVRLISDILDIERIKFGKVTMEKRLCDAADLMTQSGDAMRAMAEKAGIQLVVSPLSAPLWADPDRIIQTFTNLLGNAIKFSPPGTTVWLTAERVTSATAQSVLPSAANKPMSNVTSPSGAESTDSAASSPSAPAFILFRVQDQGVGIPADKLETIFDRFQQVDASNSRSQGGTGLGLTICRGIVQQHEGHIWVESRLGEGSTFCLTLPLYPTESP